jgi:hypothetical protein
MSERIKEREKEKQEKKKQRKRKKLRMLEIKQNSRRQEKFGRGVGDID